MLFSLRNTLRSIALLTATIAFAPGCDDGQMEALGLSAEQIDAMSSEELDELAELDDFNTVLRPADPDPAGNPDELGITKGKRPGTVDEIANAIHFTHTETEVDALDELRNPIRFTHSHKRPGTVPGITNEVHPTHSDPPADEAVGELDSEHDSGCDTHADDPDYNNG